MDSEGYVGWLYHPLCSRGGTQEAAGPGLCPEQEQKNHLIECRGTDELSLLWQGVR